MNWLKIVLLLGMFASGTAMASEEIKPKTILIIRSGNITGYIYTIEGKDYLLNSEGGILKLE